jgi:MFS family permease
MSRAGDAVRETGTSLRTVFANANLRRLNLAFAGSATGDWAYGTAMLIWAYDVGGARAVGIWFTVRLVLLTIVTPFAATLADRYSRKRVMIGADLIRAVLCLAVAGLIFVEAAPLLVFVLATLAALVGAPFRPAVGALMPSLARTPEELTAANGTISTIESLAFFIGPAIGGVLVTLIDIPIVVVFQALTFLWSAVLVGRIAVAVAPAEQQVAEPAGASHGPGEPGSVAGAGGVQVVDGPAPAAAASAEEPAEEPAERFFAESMAGFRTIWRSPDLRLVSGVYAAQTVVAGASAVFGVEMAVQMTDFGANGVGYLDSAMGIGALLGGLIAIGRAQAGKLATDFGVGVLFWALPLLLTAIWPQMWAAFLAMFIIGMANPVVDVNASTILQRRATDEVLGRVFGALDTALIAAMALGSALMPLLIHWLGLEGALAALAALVTLAVLPAFGRLRRMNAALREPEGLVLLRGLPLFAPLDPKSLETIAGKLIRVPVRASEAVIREGEEGDRFYLIESGALTATHAGQMLSQMGPGDPFGEIALLRDVPRTATVTADVDSVLLALERQEFLDAVTGDTEVTTRADDLISRRIPTY